MRDLMLEADKYYRDRNFRLAFELYEQEISTRPTNILAYDRAARCLWMLKRPLDAIAMCRNILNLDPGYVMAHVIMAEAYYDLKDFSKAEEKMRLAYSMDSSHIEVLTSYGSLLLFEKKMDEAQDILEKTIQKDPDNYVAYNNLAVIYVAKRNREKVLYCAKEMHRLRRSAKNSIRLLLAYMDYYRITNVLLAFLIILALISQILQLWVVFWAILSIILLSFLFRRYLSR